MRFLDYMKLSSSDDEASFRSINLRLVKDDTSYNSVIERLNDKYSYITEAIDIKTRLNTELKKLYKGQYKYDFCIDEGMQSSGLKIKPSYKQRLSMKCLISNDELAKIKKRFEEELG